MGAAVGRGLNKRLEPGAVVLAKMLTNTAATAQLKYLCVS